MTRPDTPAATPAGPPPAADTAGERCEGCHMRGAVELVRIQVPNGVLILCRQCLDAVNRKNPALLALGPRLAALEAALQRMVAAVEASWEDCVEVQGGLSGLELRLATVDARAALGAAGPGGAT